MITTESWPARLAPPLIEILGKLSLSEEEPNVGGLGETRIMGYENQAGSLFGASIQQ